jgi:hypothetical protein
MSAYRSKAEILVPLTALRLQGQSILLLESAKVERFADAMRQGHEFPPVRSARRVRFITSWTAITGSRRAISARSHIFRLRSSECPKRLGPAQH